MRCLRLGVLGPEWTRNNGRLFLQLTNSPEFTQTAIFALVDAATDEDPLFRVSAITVLGNNKRGGSRVVPLLVAALEDVGICGYAATALSEFGPEEVKRGARQLGKAVFV